MHIQCVICSDLITQNAIADIVGLACGHVFHGLCLRTWLDRSATCPQCRAKVTVSKQFKIFITLAAEPEDVDVATLTRNLDNLKYELKLKKVECNTLTEELANYKNRAALLVQEVKTLQTKLVSVEDINLQLKEQRKYANNKARELSEAKFMIESLENELRQYQTLKAIVKSTNDEVDTDLEVLGPAELSFLLKTFKKDINRLSKMDEELKKALSKSESEKLNLVKKNHEYQESLCLKERVIESLKDSLTLLKERETILKKLLEEKPKAVSDSHSESDRTTGISKRNGNSVLMNGLDTEKENKEEPISRKKIKLSSISSSDTGDIERKKSIEKVWLCHAKITQQKAPAGVRITSDRLQGIKVGNSLKQTEASMELSYDGMGGHSKPDVFPSAFKPRKTLARKFTISRK